MKNVHFRNVVSLFDGISCGQLALRDANIDIDNYYASEVDKYAIQIAMKNFPNTIQLGDVTKWRDWDIDWSRVDLLIGGSPCFVAGTLVLTSNGYKPIEDISVGDMVLTHTGNFRKVNRIGGNKNVKTRIIKGYGNIGIETTDEHPFYSRSMYREWDKHNRISVRKFSNPKWVNASNLTSADYCGIVKTKSCSGDVNYDFWYMIGRYAGDGWYRKTKRKNRNDSYVYQFMVCCGKHEFDFLKSKFEKFGYNFNYSEERTGYKFRVCSMDLVNFVSKMGVGASNKRVHPDLILESIENKKAFLDGLFDSDGNYRIKSDSYRLTTTSKELAYGVQKLITDVYDRPASIEFCKRPDKCTIEGRLVNQKDTYAVSFKKDIRKQDKAFNELGYSWMPVKSNEYSGNECDVYNLEVDIDNSYTANNIVVHNCQGFSFAGKQLNFDDPRSSLFFCFVDILEHIRKVNPNVKFLLENVRMKKEFQDVITGFLGVSPVFIDSALVSAQTRKRLYWANWKFEQPEDGGVLLKDVLVKSVDENFIISEKASRRIMANPRNRIITDVNSKSGALMAVQYKMGGDMLCKAEPICVNSKSGRNGIDGLQPSIQDRIYSEDGKMPAVTTSFHPYITYECKKGEFKVIDGFTDLNGSRYKIKLPDGVYVIRKLTPVECERLQTMPDGYTDCVSDSRRYHALGNGWTKEVIRHIFSFIPND